MDSIYEYLPYGQTPFRPAGLLPATQSVDSDIENLIQKLDLLHLYHLDRLCINLITHICKAIQMVKDTEERNLGSDLLLADKIPPENDILSLVQGLIKSYPQVGKLFDSDLLVSDVFAARTTYQEKRKVTPTPSLLKLEHLQESVQRAIIQGKWDRTIQPKIYLESFALGSIPHGDEEALVYLCMEGSECDTAIDEVVAQWNEYRKVTAGDIRKLKALLGGLLGGTSGYATAFRMMQWAELSNFQPFWEGTELFDTIMPEGDMPDGFWAFPIFRSDELIEVFMVRLEMLLATWQEAMIRLRGRKGWPTKNDRSDYISFAAVAAAFVFGYFRLKSSSIDKTLVADVINWLLDARQVSGWHLHHSDEVDEKDIAITAMVVHALSLAKRNRHKRILKSAAGWLSQQRQPYGCWGDSSTAYTTVLVLDAMELANGGTQVTFVMEKERQPGQENKSIVIDTQKWILSVEGQLFTFPVKGKIWAFLIKLISEGDRGCPVPKKDKDEHYNWKHAYDMLRTELKKKKLHERIKEIVASKEGEYRLGLNVKTIRRQSVALQPTKEAPLWKKRNNLKPNENDPMKEISDDQSYDNSEE